MMIYLIGISIFLLGIIAKTIRYAETIQNQYFKTWGWLRGIDVQVHRSDELSHKQIQRILVRENKGVFFEKHISRKAWLPLYSIESEDGPRWKRMHDTFIEIFKKTRTRHHLPRLIKTHFRPLQSNQDTCEMVACIMFELLFRKKLDNPTLYYQASMEWRKEIAMRGWGDGTLKRRMIQHIERHIPKKLFQGKDRMETISCFLQPFFISPMINISDVMASIALSGKSIKEPSIVKTMMSRMPPFPILERAIDDKTHCIVLIKSPVKNKSLLFGAGARRCPGSQLAQYIMSGMIRESIIAGEELFHPDKGHRYSGRNNDEDWSLESIAFMTCLIVRCLLFAR